VFEVQSFGFDTRGPQLFCLWFIAVSMLRCLKSAQTSVVSCVSSRYCCSGNHAAGSKPS